MADPRIPPEVVSFIQRHVVSIDRLETIVLLQQDASRAWTAAEVAAELRCPEDVSASALASLEGAGLFRSEGDGGSVRWRFDPVRQADRTTVIRLVDCYRVFRTPIIAAIYDTPRSSVKTFADAFRIRKEEE